MRPYRCLFLPLACLAFVFAAWTARAADYDLLIQNARIADGTWDKIYPGSVAVKEGRIAAIGEIHGTAEVTIDAEGRVLAPGFIDVHTHSEKVAKLPVAENFLRMGVTTIITGNCGMSRSDIGEFFAELEKAQLALHVAALIGHGDVREKAMGGSFLRAPNPEQLEAMRAMVAKAMDDG
ncbi:MAG: amidohydrolase family protein, partial [Roseimicrobium sp.]